MLKIFLSSTYRDLAEYRSKILDRLNAAFRSVGMEEFIPDGSNSQEMCIRNLKQMKKNGVVIFLISPYYGSLIEKCSLMENCKAECPMKTGDGQISYTHCEFKTAVAEGILHQTYLVGKGWDSPDVKKEALKFKEEISNEFVGFIDMEDPNLVQQICANLANEIIEWHIQDKLDFIQFVDREKELNDIIKNIDSKIELWGVGGVGKTSLIQVALLIQKLKGKKILMIGTTKTYASGSGFEDFRKKCATDQYITDSQVEISIYDILKALAKVNLLDDAEEVVSSLIDKIKIKNFILKSLREEQNLIIFIDDFHLATKYVVDLVKSLDNIIICSRKNTYIAKKEICITGIDKEDREALINLFSDKKIPENVRNLISNIAEGHPVATELLVKNYQRIDFNNIKNFNLMDASETRVQDFYLRVIEEIFSSDLATLNLLKNLSVLDEEYFNRDLVPYFYDIPNLRSSFNVLIDTGMLKRVDWAESLNVLNLYEFTFKHIKDALEQKSAPYNHEMAIKYYKRKQEVISQKIDEKITSPNLVFEIRYLKVSKKNETETRYIKLSENDYFKILFHKSFLNNKQEVIEDFFKFCDKILNIKKSVFGLQKLFELAERLVSFLNKKDIPRLYITCGNICSKERFLEGCERYYFQAINFYKELERTEFVNYSSEIASIYILLGDAIRNKFSPINKKMRIKMVSAYLEAFRLRKQLIEKRDIDTKLKLVEVFRKLGYIFLSLNKFKDAEKIFLGAYKILQSIKKKNYPELAHTFADLGYVSGRLRKYKECDKYYFQALKIFNTIAENEPNEDNQIVFLNIKRELAMHYTRFGRFNEAIKELLNIKTIYKDLSTEGSNKFLLGISEIDNILGNLHYYLQNYKESKHAFSSALNIYEKLSSSESYLKYTVCHIESKLGEICLRLEKLSEADKWLDKALECLSNFYHDEEKEGKYYIWAYKATIELLKTKHKSTKITILEELFGDSHEHNCIKYLKKALICGGLREKQRLLEWIKLQFKPLEKSYEYNKFINDYEKELKDFDKKEEFIDEKLLKKSKKCSYCGIRYNQDVDHLSNCTDYLTLIIFDTTPWVSDFPLFIM